MATNRMTSACCTASCFARKDRKSTRLNSSHSQISYAVFCLKKKKLSHRVCMAAKKPVQHLRQPLVRVAHGVRDAPQPVCAVIAGDHSPLFALLHRNTELSAG